MKIILTIFAILSAVAATGCSRAAAQQSDVEIKWLLDIKDGEYTPEGKIYLLVGARKILILPDATERYNLIERKDYKQLNIPPSALTAIYGWWAGQGKQLYIIRRGKRLFVYIRYLDEGTPIPPYERLKIIKLSK